MVPGLTRSGDQSETREQFLAGPKLLCLPSSNANQVDLRRNAKVATHHAPGGFFARTGANRAPGLLLAQSSVCDGI
jgi:hypothetical protein